MRRLARPQFAAPVVLDGCVASIQDASLKARLALVADTIEVAELDYLDRGEALTLWEIPQADNVDGAVSGAEMERVYSGTFVKSTRTRHFYDAIKKLPPNDVCPMCGQRTVSTLDHYLAQSRHPSLIIVPANLVPSCGDCNKIKLNAQPASAGEQTFHPYFDDFDDARWLYATVEETAPARLVYRAHPPAAWPEVRRERVVRHFGAFGLASLYASHSAVELTNIRYYLSRLAERGSAEMLKEFLAAQAESCSNAYKNSWQTAAYFAFSESDWLCSGGFAAV